MKLVSSPEVANCLAAYPPEARMQIDKMRVLILETAEQMGSIDELEETLKWGEPSYISKYGSTLRIAWSSKRPDQVGMYFKCTSKLVETFKTLCPTDFRFEGNRAIIFSLNEKIPLRQLRPFVRTCLAYHGLKKLPLLGLNPSEFE